MGDENDTIAECSKEEKFACESEIEIGALQHLLNGRLLPVRYALQKRHGCVLQFDKILNESCDNEPKTFILELYRPNIVSSRRRSTLRPANAALNPISESLFTKTVSGVRSYTGYTGRGSVIAAAASSLACCSSKPMGQSKGRFSRRMSRQKSK